MEAERQARVARKKKEVAAQRESKPGYCENCRDKYEDFEEVSCHLGIDRGLELMSRPAYRFSKAPQVCDDTDELDGVRCAFGEAARTMTLTARSGSTLHNLHFGF